MPRIKQFKKPIIIMVAFLVVFFAFSQTAFGKRLNLPAGLIEAVKTFFAGNPVLHACDYKDGTIILIKPVATGVGDGRYEAGDVVEVRDGTALCERFGNKDPLGKEEKTNLLPVYYPGKLTDEQKKMLTESVYSDTNNPDGHSDNQDQNSPQLSLPTGQAGLKGENNNTPPLGGAGGDLSASEPRNNQRQISSRRQSGIDYTKFLSSNDILKVRNFEKLDRLPEIDLSNIIQKQPDQKSVVKIPQYLAKIENAKNTLNKLVREIIPIAYAGTGGTKTICTSGCDYTTLNGWEGGEQGVLTSPAIAQITEGFQDTTAVIIDGWTTSAANYIKIYTTGAARHAGKWDTGKYYLDVSNAVGIEQDEDYVIIDGLQITVSAVNANEQDCIYSDNSKGFYANLTQISNCIVKGAHSTSYRQSGIYFDSFAGNLDIWNTIVYGIGKVISASGIYYACGLGTGNIYSTTVIVDNIGIQTTNGTLIVKNSYASGIAAYSGTSGAMTLTTSASSDTTGSTGLQNIAVNTTNFTNVTAGSEDFHLPVGSALINVGTDTSGSTAPLNFTTDIDNQDRTGTWDIGADEYVASVSAPTVTNSTGASNLAFTTARLNGEVTATGGENPTVHIYWGTSDGSTATTSWTNDVNLGALGAGTFYTDISSLTAGTTYYYRSYATNSGGSAWAASTATFNTTAIVCGDGTCNGTETHASCPADCPLTSNTSGSTIVGKSQTNLLTNGLVGYWSFDGANTNWSSATAGTTNDLSGNNNTGTMTNMSRSTSPVSGISGQALSVDGVDDYISVPNQTYFAQAPFSVSAWFKLSKLSSDKGAGEYLICMRNSSAPYEDWYIEQWTDNKLYSTIKDSGGSDQTIWSNSAITSTGVWYHVVFTVDASYNETMYINGVQQTKTNNAGSFHSANDVLNIGASSAANSPFQGQMDEVRVYNRALSASEIKQLYNAGAVKMVVNAPSGAAGGLSSASGLIGYWSFNGANTNWSSATAGTTNDLSGYGNTGTMYNMSRSTSPVAGISGQALNFDGVDDLVAVTDAASLKPAGDMTVATWVKLDVLPVARGERAYLIHKAGVSDQSYALFVSSSSNKPIFQWTNTTPTEFFASYNTALTTGIWYHLVGVKDGAVLRFYFNGSAAGTTTDSPTGTMYVTSPGPLRFGSPNASGRLDGQMDEVRIYNRALSASEIQQLYRQKAAQFSN